MCDELKGVTVIEDVILETGLRRVHLLADSKVHDEAGWKGYLEKVAEESHRDLVCSRYCEVGMYHIRMIWPVKGELVELGENKGFFWRISEGEKLSEVGERMVWMHRGVLDCYPKHVFVSQNMKGHAGKMVFNRDDVVLLVEVAEWLEENCVMVM